MYRLYRDGVSKRAVGKAVEDCASEVGQAIMQCRVELKSELCHDAVWSSVPCPTCPTVSGETQPCEHVLTLSGPEPHSLYFEADTLSSSFSSRSLF